MDLLGPIAFAASTGVAHVLTNLDNLAVLIGLCVVMGHRKAMLGFYLAQAALLLAVLLVAESLEGMLPAWTGLLGIIPIGLGLRTLFQKADQEQMEVPASRSSVVAVSFLFMGMSTDSFAVLAPLMAETSSGFRFAGFLGAVTAAVLMGLLAMTSVRAAGVSRSFLQKLERLGPFVMILAGIYIMTNSGTDMVQ